MYMDEMMTTYVLDATCQQIGALRHVILCLCTIYLKLQGQKYAFKSITVQNYIP